MEKKNSYMYLPQKRLKQLAMIYKIILLNPLLFRKILQIKRPENSWLLKGLCINKTGLLLDIYYFCAPSYWSRVKSPQHYGCFLKDFRNIVIIHFRLFLKESTLDSIGHDLWKNIT